MAEPKPSDRWIVYTDGASSGNPGPSGWGAIVQAPNGRVEELGGHLPQATNNAMEILGAIEALRWILYQPDRNPSQMVDVYTDSQYLIRGITEWVPKWKRNGWKTLEGNPVVNQDYWKSLESLVQQVLVSWKKVSGHQGIPGNERADAIAVAYSKNKQISLFSGELKNYSVLTQIPLGEPQKPGKPFYISLVDGEVVRHQTWEHCQSTVSGRRGAKYKKVYSESEANRLLAEWKTKD